MHEWDDFVCEMDVTADWGGSCIPSVREWGRCYDKTRKIIYNACFYYTIYLTILYPVKEQQGNKIFT